MPSSEGLEVTGLSAAWAGATVLDRISFSIGPGEFVTLMGPNGSGKTTLLRTLVGLERPTGGSIRLNGRDLEGVPSHLRRIGLVFQEPTLLPRRTVWENVAYGPQLQRRTAADTEENVAELLRLLHLSSLAERSPEALSGGERQRVALARTLAARPSIILLDEPFASVDAELRAELRAEFRSVLRQRGASVLHVTHDRDEGLFLGERVLILIGGRLAQQGTAREVYGRPASAEVARFLGFNVVVEAGGTWAVHPTRLRCGPSDGTGVTARVVASGFAGEHQVIYLEGPRGERWESRVPVPDPAPPAGATVGVRWSEAIRVPSDEREPPSSIFGDPRSPDG